jgi:hypothetical protein
MTAKTKTSLAAQIAATGVDHLADDFWDNLGGTYPAIVELEVCERTEPSDTEGDKKVKLRVVGIEIPTTSYSREDLRERRRQMYANRTGKNTLFDDQQSRSNVLRDGSGLVTSVTFKSEDAAGLKALADELLDDDEEHVFVDTAAGLCKQREQPAGHTNHDTTASTDQE